MNQFRFTAFALACVVLLSGCNVFEGLYEAGTSNNPEVLMADAQQAMQAGEPEKAVVILEKAVEKAPPASVQRVKAETNLGTAKLQAANVGVMQFQRIVDDLNTRIDNASSGKGGVVTQGVCSFAAPDRAIEELKFSELDAFESLSKNQQTLAEVNKLASTAFARHQAIKANESTNASDLEQLFVQYWSFVRQYVQRNGVTNLRPDADLFVPIFTNVAIGRAGLAYFKISQAGGDQIKWYTVNSPVDGNYLGYCAPSQQVIDQIEEETACAMSDIEMGVEALEIRAAFFDSGSVAVEVAEKAREGYVKLRQELKGTCSR